MKHIGVIIELDKGRVKEANFGMITLARSKHARLFAFVMDGQAISVKTVLESFGITTIVEICLAPDQQNNPAARAKAMINAIKEFNISMVFGLSTAMGKDLLPRIAAKLDAPLVMDCFFVDLEQKTAKTYQYSGKTIATIQLSGQTLLFGIRPNAIEPVKAEENARILKFDSSHIAARNLRVIKAGGDEKGSSINLAEADVIIAGGRGMKNSENFNILFQCASKINAAVGASRVAVDSGWVPYSMQVGQTGEKVSPKVYIACGISGSIQHFAGMKTSGMIIAINTDETAAILSNCDYYVKADALEIIPALTRMLDNGQDKKI